MSTGKGDQYNGMVLVDERRAEQCYSIFFKRKKAGAKCLCILRRQPEDVSLQEELKDVECYWLLLRKAENSIRPSDLGRIDNIITSFLERNKGGTVLLDGFEMLMLFNDYADVAQLLSKARLLADSNEGAIIIPVDRRAIYREDFEKISEDFGVVELDRAEKL